MNCPKCACAEAVKNGKMEGKQRYKCKSCGCNYTQGTHYRTPHEIRVECIKLYLEGVGFRGIARLTGVSHVIVQRWVKELGDKIHKMRPETGKIAQVSIMEIDEMWHFVQKKRTNAGSG
jgi:transposase-like protein